MEDIIEERRHSSSSAHRVGFAEEEGGGGGNFSDDDTYSGLFIHFLRKNEIMWFKKCQLHSFPDEPIVPTMSKGRRGTVFAEVYNPEEDDEDDVKVNPLILILKKFC